MANAETYVSFPGVGLKITGRVAETEARRQFRELWENHLEEAQKMLARLEIEEPKVSWWNGSKQLDPPKDNY